MRERRQRELLREVGAIQVGQRADSQICAMGQGLFLQNSTGMAPHSSRVYLIFGVLHVENYECMIHKIYIQDALNAQIELGWEMTLSFSSIKKKELTF